MDTSVLIIGAGPTGLMLALELSILQIPFRIIDANLATRPAYQSRALAIHPRTLELLARHDLAERFLAAGLVLKSTNIFLKRTLLWKIRQTKKPTGDTMFPHSINLRQPLAEKFLEERLVDYGGTVERGVSAERIATDEDGKGASVWVRHKSVSPSDTDSCKEEKLIKCQYVVGCDGMYSVVRTCAGIKFEGSSYPEEYMLTDAHVEWNFEKKTNFFIDRGFMVFLPLDGKDYYRIVCKRSPPNTGLFSAFWNFFNNPLYREPKVSEFNDSAPTLVPGNTHIHSPTWLSTFRINSRLASTFYDGRILLAGDAAHVHAPVGGQGMNSGIQDAVNLGWKLARVLRSSAPTSLLESYNTERRELATVVVRSTERMFHLLSTSNLLKIWLRNFIWSWVLPYFGSPNAADNLIRRISQLSIRYRRSPIVNTATGWSGKLRGGSRAPDGWIVGSQGERFTLHQLCKKPADYLIIFGGDENPESHVVDNIIQQLKSCYLDLVVLKIYHKVVPEKMSVDSYADPEGKIHTLYQFDRPGYVLIRPDGYISHIGPISSLGQLRNWMSTCIQYQNDID